MAIHFPRWGSNSQPLHILAATRMVTVYKYNALTDCATGDGHQLGRVLWTKLNEVKFVILKVIFSFIYVYSGYIFVLLA